MAIKLGAAVVVAFALYYLCAASLIGQVAAQSGEATYYTPPYTPSACFGYDAPPSNGLFAAASPGIFQNKAACGNYYTITCTGATSGQPDACTGNPTVTVEIIDLCPGCSEPGFDLSETAFSQISYESVGRININYSQD